MTTQELYDNLLRFINMASLSDAQAEHFIEQFDELCEKLMKGEKLCNG